MRYILRQNPIRRDEIRKNTQEKIQRLQTLIDEKVLYYNTHYKAKKETLVAYIEKKIGDLKLSSFVSYDIQFKSGDCIVYAKDGTKTIKTKELADVKLVIDHKAKEEAQKLDGCYVIKTSLVDTQKESKEDIHKAYKTLINVEHAFKTLKTEFLEIRPLYLRTDERIRGHIFLSMLAYNITLKLKGYVKETKDDFKSTIRELKMVKTVINIACKSITYETIPQVNEKLQKLFDVMGFTMPRRI